MEKDLVNDKEDWGPVVPPKKPKPPHPLYEAQHDPVNEEAKTTNPPVTDAPSLRIIARAVKKMGGTGP